MGRPGSITIRILRQIAKVNYTKPNFSYQPEALLLDQLLAELALSMIVHPGRENSSHITVAQSGIHKPAEVLEKIGDKVALPSYLHCTNSWNVKLEQRQSIATMFLNILACDELAMERGQ